MSIMDQNNVFMRSENRSVRPGSEGWWAQKEGMFLFSRKRTVDTLMPLWIQPIYNWLGVL